MRRDIVWALRALRKSPGFTLVAVLTLALGIGATTAVFSLVNSIVLKPLAYRDPERLYSIFMFAPKFAKVYPQLPVNARHVMTWREQSRAFSEITAFTFREFTLTGTGEPERLRGGRATANFFSVLGVRPRLGREFRAEEDVPGRDRVVMISEELWRRRFGADPSILGRKLTLDSEPYEVVGVAPAGFQGPGTQAMETVFRVEGRMEIWKPMAFTPDERRPVFGEMNFMCLGRLAAGSSAAQGLHELNSIQKALAEGDRDAPHVQTILMPLKESTLGGAGQALKLLLAAVAFVLLIVCVNLANLMLARNTARQRELAVRAALGAGLVRLMRHTLAEGLVLAAGGGVLGVALAFGLVRLVTSRATVRLPRIDEVSVDGAVLGFALGVSLLSAVLCALLPALRAARIAPQQAFQAGSRSATESRSGGRVRATLVAAEVALSVILLAGAGLLLNSFVRLMAADRGFDGQQVLAVNLSLSPQRYSGENHPKFFYQRILEKVRALPGVRSAGVVSQLPVTSETSVNPILPKEAPEIPMVQRPMANFRWASSDYFRAMGIPLVAGRIFQEADGDQRVVVLSQRLAQRLFPDQDPVGREIRRFDPVPFRVVGVVREVPAASLERGQTAMVYFPYWQRRAATLNLVVRADMPPSALAGAIRQAAWQLDPEVPVGEFRTMEVVVASSVEQRRFQMTLLLAFALTALLLACLGIYGVVTYTVARRTNEIGIRVALGATGTRVYGLVLGQGLAPVGIGLVLGLAGSLALGRVISSFLYGVRALDPLTYAGVTVTLSVVALAACWAPAWRATRIDPTMALRYE